MGDGAAFTGSEGYAFGARPALGFLFARTRNVLLDVTFVAGEVEALFEVGGVCSGAEFWHKHWLHVLPVEIHEEWVRKNFRESVATKSLLGADNEEAIDEVDCLWRNAVLFF